MIEKKRWLLITFHTTSEAMAMEQRCQEAGPCRASDPRSPHHHRRLRPCMAGRAVPAAAAGGSDPEHGRGGLLRAGAVRKHRPIRQSRDGAVFCVYAPLLPVLEGKGLFSK